MVNGQEYQTIQYSSVNNSTDNESVFQYVCVHVR